MDSGSYSLVVYAHCVRYVFPESFHSLESLALFHYQIVTGVYETAHLEQFFLESLDLRNEVRVTFFHSMLELLHLVS